MFPISDSEPSKKFPFINIGIILLTCYVFFLQQTNSDAFTYMYALVPGDIDFSKASTLYPFITSMFLHGGWLHIISNMWFLWVFGDNVEGEIGHIPYLFLYILSGLAGGFAQYFFMPDSTIPMLGASGAVAGALGAYFYFFPHNKIRTIIPFFGFLTMTQINASFMLGYWFVLQILSGAMSLPSSGSEQGGVAFWAHVGGFLTGLLIGRLFAKTDKNVIEGEII
jgi:membrane associated rhomboid family serine protease